MKITNIEINYSSTWSLGNYSNVRPAVKLAAELAEGDDPDVIVAELMQQARRVVQWQIDEALEAEGTPAHFFDGPRYEAAVIPDDKLVALVPEGSELPGGWAFASRRMSHHRHDVVCDYCEDLALTKGYLMYSCSGGDFSRLPEVEQFKVLYVQLEATGGYGYIVTLPGDINQSEMPGRWASWDWCWDKVLRLHRRLFEELNAKAGKRGWQFIDCTDGDLSRLPELPEKAAGPDGVRLIDVDDDFYDEDEEYDESDD